MVRNLDRRIASFALLLFFGSVLAAGCSRGSETAQPSDSPAGAGGDATGATDSATSASEPSAPPGSISLVARYTGAIPAPQPLTVDVDPEHCTGKVFDRSLIVDAETRGLANVVLRLEKVRGSRTLPSTITITNKDCAFEPRVQVAMRGVKLGLANEDPVMHTTHAYEKNVFNQSLKKSETTPPIRPLRDAGIMRIKCDVHPWMLGWVVVHDNPYVEKTDEKGRLTIDQIPPGTYDYTIWHEKYPDGRTGKVTVESGSTAEITIDFGEE